MIVSLQELMQDLQKDFKAKHKIVRNSGHNTHLEDSKRFIEIVINYLTQIDAPPPKQAKSVRQKNDRKMEKK